MYENTSMTPADMAAVMGNRSAFGNGMFGDGAWWIIILFLFAMNGGWGNGFGFGGGNGPVMLGQATNDVQRGFDQASVINGINGISAAVSNGFAQAEISANGRQMAELQQNNAILSALQQCCCDNRAATADLKYTMATEAAATRANCDANNQRVLDKLCQLELDGVKQNYEGQLRAMQNQLAAANAENQSLRFAASQGAQTSAILANNEAQTAALEQYLAPVPRPAYIVQNPNGCGNTWTGCGCGAN